MNIKISGLRSGLNYNDMLNPITGGFISDIEEKPCGNHHIVFYGHHAEDIRRVMRSIL